MDEDLELALRQSMSLLIPEIQEEVDDYTVYCEPCGNEYDYTPSVLALHNLRHHEEYLDDNDSD